jgi:hypothetical protein
MFSVFLVFWQCQRRNMSKYAWDGSTPACGLEGPWFESWLGQTFMNPNLLKLLTSEKNCIAKTPFSTWKISQRL